MPIHRSACSPVLRQFIDAFETRFVSLSLAGSWDNVGLLVEPPKLRNNPRSLSELSVFVTVDLTQTVVEEAVVSGCDLVFCYHPLLFAPTQSFTPGSQSVAVTALANGVAVFSPHTALDSMDGGINDLFLDRLQIFENRDERDCCLLEGETRVGRVAVLRESLALVDLIARVKSITGSSVLRYALPAAVRDLAGVRVTRLAFCAGAGGSVLKGPRAAKADCVVTGEMSHHEILFHTSQGRSVLLTEHTNCERPLVRTLAERLARDLGIQRVAFSASDADPVRFA